MFRNKQIWVIITLSFLAGYLMGRLAMTSGDVKTRTIVKTERGGVVRDTIVLKEPARIIYRNIPIPIDTAQLYARWSDLNSRKEYNFDFSSDSIGEFKVDVALESNSVVSATSEVRPIIRTITTEKTINRVPFAQFYGSIGSSLDLNWNKVEIGIDFKQRYLIGVSGVRHGDEYGYTLNFGVKF